MFDLSLDKEIYKLFFQQVIKNRRSMFEVIVVYVLMVILTYYSSLVSFGNEYVDDIWAGLNYYFKILFVGIMASFFFLRVFVDSKDSLYKILSQLNYKYLMSKMMLTAVLYVIVLSVLSTFITKDATKTSLQIGFDNGSIFLVLFAIGFFLFLVYIITYIISACAFSSLMGISEFNFSLPFQEIRNTVKGAYLFVAFRFCWLVAAAAYVLIVLFSSIFLVYFTILLPTFLFVCCFAHSIGMRPKKKEKVKSLKFAIEM